MKKKIICILVMTLLIATILPITGTVVAGDDNQEAIIETMPLSISFVFGIMEKISPVTSTVDYEVTLFAFIIGGGEIQQFNAGEMIRLYAPMLIYELGKIVIGTCSDWSIIG